MGKEMLIEVEKELKKESIARGLKVEKFLRSRLLKGDMLEFTLCFNGAVRFIGGPSEAYSAFFEPTRGLESHQIIGILHAKVRGFNRDLHSRGYDFTLDQEDVYGLLELCAFYQELDKTHFLKVRCKWLRWRGEACQWEGCKKGCRNE